MKIYKVGGCVRDEIMGILPKDIDYVVVGSTPSEMLKLHFKQVGSDFPVFIHPTSGEEYALARTERKTGAGYNGFDTNHATTVTLEDDLIRRDLTMNSIAQDIETGEIIDPFSGRRDIERCIIRHTSQAFAEDPVRTLRVARFVARYGFRIHPSTVQLMMKMNEYIHLTPERVWKETSKSLMEPYADQFFVVLDSIGILCKIFPNFTLGNLDHIIAGVHNNVSLEVRLVLAGFTSANLTTLKAPSECIKFTKCWQRTVLDVEKLQSGNTSTEDILNIFNRMDMFRNKKHILWFNELCNVVTPFSHKLKVWFDKANQVAFSDLEGEAKNATGKMIGVEIDNLRVKSMVGDNYE